MKKFLMKFGIAMIMLVSVFSVSKADIVTVGNGTTHSKFPFFSYYHDAASYFLYTSQSIKAAGGASGVISSLAFNITNTKPGWNFNGLQISLMNTNMTSLATLNFPINLSMQLVYTHSGSFVASTLGWNTFNFQTNFEYDDTQNLIVKVCFDNTAWESNDPTVSATFTTTQFARAAFTDGGTGCSPAFTGGTPNYETPTSLTFIALPDIRFNIEMGPSLVAVYPVNNSVLETGLVFATPPHKPGVLVNRKITEPVRVSYEIRGPLPNNTLIYQALSHPPTDPASSTWVNIPTNAVTPYEFRFGAATGPAARDPQNLMGNNDGALDFFTGSIQGGMYEVIAKLKYQPGPNVDAAYEKEMKSLFYVTLGNDIAVTEVLEPKIFTERKYPTSVKTPVKFEVRNVGANPITDFRVNVKVRKDGTIIWEDEIRKTYPTTMANPLASTQGMVIEYELKDFIPLTVGMHDIEVYATLLNANDDGPLNNYYPPVGMTHKFQIVYDQEPSADSLLLPLASGSYNVGRPMLPIAKFSNWGITDMTTIPVRINIENLTTGQIIHRDSSIAEDIPSGVTNNFTLIFFKKPFIPSTPGNYRACIYVDYPQDPYPANNEHCITFTVAPSLSGTYTIGTANADNARNYPTMRAAIEDLYLKGVGGNVVFELTDAVYTEGANHLNPSFPALDLRSTIYGTGPNSTVTFRPSATRISTRAGVRVNLATESGIGVMFGQSEKQSLTNPAVHVAHQLGRNDLVRQYSRSNGYIVFDGGPNKAMLFTLDTDVPFRSVFYMANAQNVTVQNVIMEDGLNQPASYTCDIPNNRLSGTQFLFDKDWDAGVRSFSTGVFVRSLPPVDDKFGFNDIYRLDTVNTNNIRILNNDISKFGYGIVSMGIGALMYNQQIKEYYNFSNRYNGNTISQVSAAGIFLGFERNTRLEGNRIDQVSGTCGPEAAGIAIGNPVKFEYMEFSNTGIYISGNEVSNVMHNNNVYGIKVRQAQEQIQGIASTTTFPISIENVITVNNIVWGLQGGDAATNKYGIRYYTKRGADFATPIAPKYFTRNDRIMNNTIVIEHDNYVNTGVVAGISLQQTSGTFMFNNAVALLDNNIDTDNEFAAALIYQGMMPKDANSNFNRNVYYVANQNVQPIVRFLQTTDSSSIVDFGHKNNFLELSQWQYWADMEYHSAFGNFMNDMEFVGNGILRYRVKTDPTPIGSILNNRGDRLPEVTNDIDGRPRGVANQRYDIGAVEFDGRLYNNDLEMMTFASPASYKESFGMFNDAEYIMTEAPVNVTARIRNSGSMQKTNANVRLDIYLERPNEFGLPTIVGELEKSKTIQVTLSSTDDMIMDFLLADEGGSGDDWTPKTYADLRGLGYTVPAHFVSMQPNVTPRYRLVVTVIDPSDEALSNNQTSKTVRFYLKRSNLSLVVSAENSHVPINYLNVDNASIPMPTMTDLDHISGRLNVDTLLAGFRRIGWVADYTAEVPRYDIDVLERNGWEPKSVDYTLYRTLVWSDANDNAIDGRQARDIEKFFQSSDHTNMKNMIIASQEFVRLNQDNYPNLVNNMIRTKYSDRDSTNLPFDVLADPLQRLVGLAMARNLETTIRSTNWQNSTVADPNPMVVYHDLNQTTFGFTRVGFYNKRPDTTLATSKIMSVVTNTLSNNVIQFGLDWRHFGNVEFILRAVVDFIEANGGAIIPVELLSFDANPVGRRVELSWTTASEVNSSRFEVERSKVNEYGSGSFSRVDEVRAAGNSVVAKEYGPVIDRRVEAGETYAYRLKMIDLTGEFTYSEERIVTLDGVGSVGISEVFPNPAREIARFDVTISDESRTVVEIVDATGKTVGVAFDGILNRGSHSISFDTKQLSSGTYTIILRNGESFVTRSFSVVR